MTTSLLTSREGRVLRLRMNRPEKRNALSRELCEALVSNLEQAEADTQIGAVLLEAEGPFFCAGMDLEDAASNDAQERTATHQQLFTAGSRMSKPIVASVQGPAMGGGVGLVANAHVVVAAQGVSFALAEIRLGMWPFVIFRALVRALGERRVMELSLTGRVFQLPEALQWGLVHESAPVFELEDRAGAIAAQLAESSRDAIQLGFQLLRESRPLSDPDAVSLAMDLRQKAFSSPDFREGLNAWSEKRKPVWPSLASD